MQKDELYDKKMTEYYGQDFVNKVKKLPLDSIKSISSSDPREEPGT